MDNSPNNSDEQSNEIDGVGRLINFAGAREGIPSATMNSARDRVTAHWEGVVAENRRAPKSRMYPWLALAASVAVIAVSTLLLTQTLGPSATVVVASVEQVIGEVFIDDIAIHAGDRVAEDAQIETGLDSRVALRMVNGQSLRIDRDSKLLVNSVEQVSLRSGALYIDSDSAPDGASILVSTAIAAVQDVGTQFQVRLVNEKLVVGVREGSVAIEQSGLDSLSIDHGRYIELSSDNQPNEFDLQNDDPSWSWIETLNPISASSSVTLQQFLIWYANEAGVNLRWEDSSSEARAQSIKLAGSMDGVSVEESLEMVRNIVEFELRIDGDSMWIKVE